MEIKELPRIFHVEPVTYPNSYNQEKFKTPFRELIRFTNQYKSTFHNWNTTEDYPHKLFADGFVKYNLD